MSQAKLDRLLRMMRLLTENRSLTIRDLAGRFDTSERTIYRYLETFKSAGFVVQHKADVYRIDKASPQFKEISQLIHFSEEEAYLLKSAIDSIDENNLIKQNLKKKLYSVYDYDILPETIVHKKNAANVRLLYEAIKTKQCVKLVAYGSANSNEVRDRSVEVFAFTTNYVQIWAYDLEKQANRVFNVMRIESVVLLEQPWQHEALHQKGYMDCFRYSSNQRLPISMILGLRSTQLLIEEYPLAELSLTPLDEKRWLFETEVCSYDGVGRFVLGLLDDVSEIHPIQLKDFLHHKCCRYIERL